jgi:lipopolysaccharide/colanic/teichoic acid biosynthesis glycosyltransferase/glycosyltransferase involved in cell wall biosynthesis
VATGSAPRLRICFFNRSYHPDQAATGQLLTDLAEELARDGRHEVWVVAGPPLLRAAPPGSAAALTRRRRFPFGREERNGVRILRAWGTALGPGRVAARAANYLSFFGSSCLAGLAVPRPDVVVALTDPPIIGLAALACARRTGARFVYLCQDVFPEVARLLGDFRSERVDRLLARVTRLLIARADRVVAVGETMRERLVAGKNADPGRITVIHNWADCSAIVPGPKRNPWSLAHGLAEPFVVMHSGNIGLSQDLDVLIDAAARLSAHPDIVVAIVGDGVRRADLEARVRERSLANVRFLPYQPRERLAQSFASADLFVVSLARGLAGYIVPSKLYGILASGRPYVAAVEEASEVAAITRRHRSGLLAEPGDAAGLARQILTLHGDRARGRELGANARRAALGYDRSIQVEAYARLFRELAATPREAFAPGSALKRPFDVALSGLGLLGSLPLWALIAAAVKLEDGGPVFYGQERVGRGGRRFRSWKFRSMVVDADERFGALQARQDDPRVTRTGRLLRATAMDELPQLWNILVGDMSFVGPRALRPEEIEVGGDGTPVPLQAIPGYEARHRVTPGLTGIAQIYAPRDIPRRQKFKLDQLYVGKQSFWLDLRLIALSFWITVRAKWEHRGRKV